MSLGTYAELLEAVASYADRDDLEDVFPIFVRNVESVLNKRLDDPDQEVSVTLTGNGADLPADFGAMVSIGTAYNQPLTPITNSTYAALMPVSGTPRYYTIRENKVYYAPGSANPLLVYRRSIPPLTSANNTNWLLDRAPEVYFRGVMFEEATWERDPEAAAGWKVLFEEAVSDLMGDAAKRKWGAGPIAPRIRRT